MSTQRKALSAISSSDQRNEIREGHRAGSMNCPTRQNTCKELKMLAAVDAVMTTRTAISIAARETGSRDREETKANRIGLRSKRNQSQGGGGGGPSSARAAGNTTDLGTALSAKGRNEKEVPRERDSARRRGDTGVVCRKNSAAVWISISIGLEVDE